jgi:hypothetical protein
MKRDAITGYEHNDPTKFHKHIVSEKGNERRGFVEETQYRKLADAAAGQLWLRGLLALGYTYGFRRAELVEKECVT